VTSPIPALLISFSMSIKIGMCALTEPIASAVTLLIEGCVKLGTKFDVGQFHDENPFSEGGKADRLVYVD
jgi:hypothetical protein